MLIAIQNQTASVPLFVAIAGAWTAVFGGLEGLRRRWPRFWPAPAPPRSERPWLDLGVALAVAAAVLALGQLWHAGLLRWSWPGAWQHLATALGHAIVWSPLPLALWLRRQPASSAWTGAVHLPHRLAAGAALALLAVTVFLLLRGELVHWPAVLARAASGHAIAHFLPVYMEGVGAAFLFVRLEWPLGRRAACLVPALLFAAAHVPRGLADGESVATVLAFFTFNTTFVAVLLRLLARHRDVVALGLVHWLTDLAIGAL